MNLEVSHKELSQPNSTPTDLHQEDQNPVPLCNFHFSSSINIHILDHGLYDSQENGSPKTAQAFLLYRNQAQRANKNDFSIKNEKNDQNIENPQIGKNLPREQIDDASSPSKSLHGFESFGKQYHGGSLDNLYNEAKKELNKALPPTFGDDQFNIMVNQQIADSPMNSQEKPGKIERMLQEHKKKKILQKIFAVKKEEQPSPRLGLDSSAKSSSKLSYDMLQRGKIFF